MNKKLIGAACVLALLAYGGSTWWRQRPAADPAVPAGTARGAQAGPQTVTTVALQVRDVPVSLEAAGTVVSLNSVDVRPQVSSTIRQVAIKEGQFVRRGELLFSFDDRPDRANLDKARAQLLRDQALLADLQRQWQRAQDLRAQNFIAQSAADTVLAQLDAQQAAVHADQAALQAAEAALSWNTLRAPLTGRAGAIAVYPGSLVQPSAAAPLVTISQIDPIGVSFTVPEAQLAALLNQGADLGATAVPVRVLLPGAERPRGAASSAAASAAASASVPAPALQGQLSFIDNAVDTSTGTIRLKGSVPNPRHQLWPGQYVTVQLTLRTLKDAHVVPQAALIQRGNERSVYVVADDQTASQRPVQLRYAFGEFAVVDGLATGERVVVEGKQNLRSGAKVREASK